MPSTLRAWGCTPDLRGRIAPVVAREIMMDGAQHGRGFLEPAFRCPSCPKPVLQRLIISLIRRRHGCHSEFHIIIIAVVFLQRTETGRRGISRTRAPRFDCREVHVSGAFDRHRPNLRLPCLTLSSPPRKLSLVVPARFGAPAAAPVTISIVV